MENQRFETGLKKLQEIDGEAGNKVIDSTFGIQPYEGKKMYNMLKLY